MAMWTLATIAAATAATLSAIAISMAVNLRLTTDSHDWHDRHTSTNYCHAFDKLRDRRENAAQDCLPRSARDGAVRIRRHLRGVRRRPQRQRRADIRVPRGHGRPRPRRLLARLQHEHRPGS